MLPGIIEGAKIQSFYVTAKLFVINLTASSFFFFGNDNK